MKNELSNYLNNLLFKIKIYESPGNSFQKLFSDIMALRDAKFQRICAYGRRGDGGNDGYIPSEKRYYQVYGPEYSGGNNNRVVDYAEKKLIDDFNKISAGWEKPLYFHFVYNDYFKGVAKDLIDVLDNLKTKASLTEVHLITSDDLLGYFLELNDEKKSLIINVFPFNYMPSAEEIDSSAIAQLIRNISTRYNPFSIAGIDSDAPDFDKKIQVNNLSKAIHDALRFYSHFVNLVDDFLDTQPDLAQSVAFEMQKLYAESVDALTTEIDGYADLRFMWIAEKLLTEDARLTMTEPSKSQSQRTASLVIMAKYFESCDIYEHPERAIAS
jgi:hypothetical protein